jgi:LuxR family maltose regulon positive regulatory protein
VENPLVVVVAGAGYGKTEAVYSFLKKYDAVATWIQLSERDNVGSRFWENYTRSISLCNEKLASALRTFGFPETESQFDRYLALPGDEIASGAKHIFVFDDFHLIEDPSVLRFIERSVNTPFPNLSTILVSRSEPAINTIGLFSKGLITNINEDDLRFSENEMLRYLRMQDVKLSPQTGADLYDSTGGWAFAVELIGLSLKKKPQHASCAISAMKQNIFRLIESEIFSVISENLRKFLVKLSLIDHLSLELIRELSSDEAPFAEMAKAGSFIRYDAYMDAYRIHHLFLDYLSQKRDMLTEDEKRDVYVRAARWCVAHDYKMDAISYCEKVGDYEKIIEIVGTLQLMLPNNTALFLLDVFRRVPKDVYEKNGTLCLLYTRILAGLGRFDEAIVGLKAIMEKFEAMPQTPFVCRVLFGAYNTLGFTYYLNCVDTHNYEFGRYFQKSAEYYSLSEHTTKGPVTNLSVGSYVCRTGSPEKGLLEKFIEAVAASIPHVSATMNGCTYGFDDLARAEVAYFRAEMKMCEKFAWQSLFRARERGQHEIENRALFFLMRVALAAGDYSKIQDLCKQLDLQLDRTEYINRHTLHDIVMGWYYIAIRQTARVADWLKNDFDRSDINSLMLGLENMVKCKYYLAEKRYHALLAFLEYQRNEYGLGAFLFGKLGMKILEAVSQYHLREKDAAMKALAEAYGLAYPNALDMPFIELGNDMRTLTAAAMRDKTCALPREWLEKIHKKSATYAKKLTRVISDYRDANQLGNEIHLTVRETEMLTDLYHGLSRTEIAASRDLSINTVKATLQMIYVKLDAEDGADAVRIATSLKLVK